MKRSLFLRPTDRCELQPLMFVDTNAPLCSNYDTMHIFVIAIYFVVILYSPHKQTEFSLTPSDSQQPITTLRSVT